MQNMALSYLIGMVFFFDTPNVYESGSIVECKVSERLFLNNWKQYNSSYVHSFMFYSILLFIQQVKAVHYNDTPIPDKIVYFYDAQTRRPLQNITTNSDGIGTFSLNTTSHHGVFRLTVSELHGILRTYYHYLLFLVK